MGHLAIVDLLLERGANVEATDDLGRRPLLSAARFGHTAVVRDLLDRGADINGDDWSDQTALSEAAVHGHDEIVELLLARGAKRSLLDAVALEDADLTGKLLSDGGDPDHVYYGEGRLAMYAVSRGNVAIVRLMMNHGATHHNGWHDDHPLVAEAARQGHIDAVRLLVAYGADVNAVGRDGKTVLDLATAGGREDGCRVCLRTAVCGKCRLRRMPVEWKRDLNSSVDPTRRALPAARRRGPPSDVLSFAAIILHR